MLTSVVGINWGDEGKGRMVDLLSASHDIVVRYQGGNNAGHTVINERGKFILNLLPSGILRDEIVNVLGGGMVIDIEHLAGEIERLRARGIAVNPQRLKISRRATISMPWNKDADALEEDRLGKDKQGSTRRGIGPAYSDRALRKALRMDDLLDSCYLEKLVTQLVEWKNITVAKPYGRKPYTVEETLGWLHSFGDPLVPHISDTDDFLHNAALAGKNILFEAQLGTLRDLDYGIYPYTTSSSALAAYAPIGAGVPGMRADRVIGVVKAYSSSIGGGPFVSEMFGDAGDALRDAGDEYGAATGRPRRVGAFDVVATRYGARMQCPTELALTKLDVLDAMSEIPVCVQYEIDGGRTDSFPTGSRLERAKPVIETLPGWNASIAACRRESELPDNARRYVDWIEERVGCRIRYISVGADREAYLERV
ncbi:MAG: adenylosuccinate synthase [Oscillospiraceae bacterium]|jgi:adenylosuccinate synthase|nr:adenylosuccinate synthase [Oscillospiraceae bacterium]